MKEADMDKRIERMVKSVASKKATMAQWEAERKSSEIRRAATKKWRTFISVAASVIVICAVGIGIYLNEYGSGDFNTMPAPTVFRGGNFDMLEIQAMIDSGRYERALNAIEDALADMDIIDPSSSLERQEYLKTLNDYREYELTWLKIDALVKSDKKDEAITLLKEYVKLNGEHQAEAHKLLIKISQ